MSDELCLASIFAAGFLLGAGGRDAFYALRRLWRDSAELTKRQNPPQQSQTTGRPKRNRKRGK